MPWDIYLDYLADQGFDDLRNVDVFSLITGCFTCVNDYHLPQILANYEIRDYYGYGEGHFNNSTSVLQRNFQEVRNTGEGLSFYSSSFNDFFCKENSPLTDNCGFGAQLIQNLVLD